MLKVSHEQLELTEEVPGWSNCSLSSAEQASSRIDCSDTKLLAASCCVLFPALQSFVMTFHEYAMVCLRSGKGTYVKPMCVKTDLYGHR